MHSLAKFADIPPARASAGLLILLGMSVAQAQDLAPASADDEVVIDQIVVVAHKDRRSIRDVAANVTVMTREDVNASLSASLADVFRYTPGVDYESAGSRFGDESINIRGIGGNRVAILLDGVPLSDQFDVGSFSNATRDFVDAGLIERIEVLHGPASALYGSAAIGGVVAVRTPDPADIMGRNGSGGDLLATAHGADDSLQGSGMFAFGNSSTGFLLGGSLREGEQTDSAGVDEDFDLRDYRSRSGILKVVTDDSGGHTWSAALLHQDSQVQSDLNSMLGTGRYATTTALEGDDDYRMDLVNLAYEFGSPESWVNSGTLRAYYEEVSVRQSTLDERGNATRPVAIDRYFQFDQEIAGAEVNLQKEITGTSIRHKVGFGIEYRERLTEEYRDGLETGLLDGLATATILGEAFPLRDFPVSESSEWGAYLEDVMSFGDWSVIAALRADRYDLSPRNDPMYAEDYPFAEPVSLSESDVSPKLGLIYRLGQATDVYLQYAHGFRSPPYEDANIGLEIPAFNYRAIPNPDLESESSDGFDLGLRWQGQAASFRVALFHTRYQDFIESKVRLGTDPVSGRVLFQSQNLRTAEIRGFEAGWRLQFAGAFENLATDGAIYKARGENGDNGQPLNSVGPGQAVLGLNWLQTGGKRQLRLQATLTDDWSDRDESTGELFEPPGYAVFDLYYSQGIGERMTIRAGLLNLMDRCYWSWTDVRGLSPDDPVIPYLARAGRNFSLGLSMQW
ncbi:MAG TPA: TonB-dependent hemoglobin/transferrin/lactoferrin family receptor [Woeseiaceae bacterium]|nr:TonB-dependent hemoglobin/transferrin/lactoferrin family receptor [Woeseiaceae bacterium]